MDLDGVPATETVADIYVDAIAGTINAALAVLHDMDAAQDVAHDVFLRVWVSGRWSVVRDPLAYLEAASRREAIRRVERAGRIAELVTDPPDGAPNPSETLLNIEFRARMLACILGLPKQRRRVMNLALCHGWTRRKIAVHMGITLKGVERQITLGRPALRDCLCASLDLLPGR